MMNFMQMYLDSFQNGLWDSDEKYKKWTSQIEMSIFLRIIKVYKKALHK